MTMNVETVLRRIERQCRVDAKAFAKYEPLVDGRKLCVPGPGARGEARGSVATLDEIRTLCRTLRREHRSFMHLERNMKPTIYTVHAYRWGDRECHSYSVGVYGKKHAALKAAETEQDYRGGKYECEVLEWTLDSGTEGNHDNAPKVVKALPLMNTLKMHNT